MSTTPYAAPQSHVADIETREGLEVTWGHALKVWWSITWRTVLFGLVIGFVVGVLAGVVGAASGTSSGAIQTISSLLGFVIGMLISIWAVRKALSKSFSDFRIVLLPK